MGTMLKRGLAGSLFVVTLVACGGGGSDPPPPPPPPPVGIGPAGGTVTGSNGARIVVPAGALAQTVNLQITEIAAGSANLPAGVQPASAVYALTPHGTTFAVPVTVSVPFDPAQVAAGRTLQALKTSDAALTVWGIVAGTMVSGTTASVQVTSFSNNLMAGIGLPTITTQPASVAVNVGQSATVTVVAAGNGAPLLTYQWQRNGTPIAGATAASYLLTNVTAGDNGARFSVIVGNGVGTVTSAEAVLTVNTSSAAGWPSVGPPIITGTAVRLGGLAVSPSGRVAVAYVAGSSGTAGLVGELRVSEWDEARATWQQIGPALNLLPTDSVSVGLRSIAYDSTGRIVVTWLNRLTLLLVVQRWNGMLWEQLGNPMFPVGAVTRDPQIVIDPVSNRPIVVISSGPYVTVREWNGSAWTPTVFNQNLISLFGGFLSVSRSGQRLLGIAYGENTAGSLLLARLYAPNAMGEFVTEVGAQVGGPISTTSFPANNFKLDLDNDGTNPFALIGDTRDGPLLVRRWSGSAWEGVGGDLGIPNGASAQLRVTPFGLPLVGYMPGNTSPRSVEGRWWDGSAWQSVASVNAPTVDVTHFALGLAPDGLPYVALTQRGLTSTSQLASELVVRRFVPVTLSIIVSGPAGSGSVTANGQTCAAGSTCNVPLPTGTAVALSAAPAAGFTLQSWAGCDGVVALRCTVTVNQSRTVTATFQ